MQHATDFPQLIKVRVFTLKVRYNQHNGKNTFAKQKRAQKVFDAIQARLGYPKFGDY